MCINIKFICPLLFTVTSFALDATVVGGSGTIVVFGLSKNEIVIAADSRVMSDDGKYNDHQCEIIALGDKFVFFANGRAMLGSAIDIRTNKPVTRELNSFDAAKIAFRSVPASSDGFLASVAALWGKNVRQIFSDDLKTAGVVDTLGNSPQGPILRGFFLGVSPSGHLIGYMETIYRYGDKVFADAAAPQLDLPEVIRYGAAGVTDTVDELLAEKTKFARDEVATWKRRSASIPKGELDVSKAVRWAELTVASHPGSHEVGGNIDALTFTIKGARWHSRKCECRDQHPCSNKPK